jgi:hypothetical protein
MDYFNDAHVIGTLPVEHSANHESSILFDVINQAVVDAKKELVLNPPKREAININDMFEMQMLMNHLSQLSEMSTNVVSAANAAIERMGRYIG